MRSLAPFVVLVLAASISGCGSPPSQPADTVASAASSPSAPDAPLLPRAPQTHVEVFDDSGTVVVGTRGFYHTCGGLAESGLAGYDTTDLTWDLPAAPIPDAMLSIHNVTLMVASGEYGQAEAFLFDPDGRERGRATFVGIAGDQEILVVDSALPAGEYTIEVRVCGPGMEYAVHGEAHYVG